MESHGRSATAPQLPATMAQSQRHLLNVPQQNSPYVPMDAQLSKSTMLTDAASTMNVNVYVNQKRKFPAFRNPVLYITSTDMVITLEISEINTKVVYTGSSISIDLPYTLFGGNTEGQCGTCDNSQNNDCRSPNGQVESCSDSAGQWHVPGTPCVIPTTPPITTTPTPTTKPATTTQPPCKPAICDILTSSVFKACHTVIPPGPFVQSCVSDNCNGDNNTCTSLEAYATECSNEGVCIDWRNATNGRCEHTCPKNKVYKACGTSVEPTCNDRYNKKFETGSEASTNNTIEGCFCRPGTILFNTPGDKWSSGCNTCECDKDSMSIQCEPATCPTVQSPVCSGPGQQLVNNTDGCCTTQSCECNVNLCPQPITCPVGFQPNVTSGTCCQSYECVPKGVCVYDMNEYKNRHQHQQQQNNHLELQHHQEQDNLQEQQQHHQEQDNLQEQQQHHQEQDNLQEQQQRHQEQDNLQEQQQRHQEQDNLQEQQQHHQEQDNLQEQQQHHQEQDNLQEQQQHHQEQDNLQEQQQHHQEQDNHQEQQQRHQEQDNLQEQQQHHQEQDNLQEQQQHHQEQDNLQEQQQHHQEQDNHQEQQQHHQEQDNHQEQQQHHQEQDNLQEQQQHHQEQDNLQEQQQHHQEQDNLQEQQQHHQEQDNLQEQQQRHQEQDNHQEQQQHHQEQDNLQEQQQRHQEQDNHQEQQQHHQEQDNLQEQQQHHQEQDNLQEQQQHHQEQDNLQEQQQHHQEQDNLQEQQQHHQEHRDLSHQNPARSGYEYQTLHGKCCGKCVQKSCIFTTQDNTTHILEVNNTFIPTNDKCVKYTCEKMNGHLVTKETKTTCSPFNPLDCEPGTETTDTTGCCKTCKRKSVCEMKSKLTVMEVSGCKSAQPLNITSCAGHCGSSSIYSAAANMMMHQCECCQEASVSKKSVELTCADGSKVNHSYTAVDMCSCRKADCVPGTTSEPPRRGRR
ncbi:hypothetical protein NQZ68_024523 [Dissostichus eleginoides]|nr:hypothetical protein NQZ68_024523 [Dissostichus eleginoides]